MQDIRGQRRAERDLVGRDQLQRCVICSRWFIKRRDTVCSRDCQAKLEASQEGQQTQ
jgi:hypothetical protein